MARSLIAASLLMLPLFSFANSTVPLSGDFRVTEQGAASYTLPIAIPKARGGLQAQMAIQYSSSGQNGPMGLGMALSAGSAVSRCPQTIVQDGAIRGIELGVNDRFCLDGQRLVLASGSYGADGSTYRKEIDDYSIVTALGQAAAGGPLAFKVETKSGDTHYYGNVASVLPAINLRDAQGNSDANDAALVIANRGGQSVALNWSIKGTVDPLGNYISYQYGLDAAKGEQWLQSVASGGHLGLDQSPYVEARVSYVANPRPRYGFVAGVPYSQTKLVSGIAVYQDDQLLSHYVLDYRKSEIIEEQVYLDSVKRCVGAGESDCSTPVVFHWLRPDQLTVSSTEIAVDDFTGKTVTYEIPTQNFVPFEAPVQTSMPIDGRLNAQAFDMTGDGKSDLIYTKNYTWYFRKFGDTVSHELTHVGVPRAEYAMSINFDGDGQRDLLVSDIATNQWHVISFQPGTLLEQVCEPLLIDGEICTDQPRDVQFKLTNLNIASEGYEENALVADVNGDGLEDIVFIKDKKIQWYKNEGGTFAVAAELYAFESGFESSFRDTKMSSRSEKLRTSAAFDANGDGRTDLLLKITTTTESCTRIGNEDQSACEDAGGIWQSDTTVSWKLYVASGSVDAPSYVERQDLGYASVNSVRTADLNGDGISDLMFYVHDRWISRLGNGYGFEPPKETGLMATETEAGRSLFIDLNGDGRSDMLKAVGNQAFHIMMSKPLDSSESMMWLSRGVISVDNSRVLQFVDTYGRGQFDLYSADESKWYRHKSRKNEFENLIEGITEGYGATTTITYSRLTKTIDDALDGEPDVYKVQHSEVEEDEGNFFALMPMVVVKQVNTEVTDASSLGVSYQYGGLVLNRKGRGMLGFGMLRTQDLQSGVVTETQYNQTHPLIGMPDSTTQHRGGYPLSFAESVYEQVETVPGAKAVYTLRSWDRSYQIGSDNLHYPLTQVYTENTLVDNWGNIEDMVVETTNLATGVLESRVRTLSVYQGAGGGAQKGRLSSASVTKTRFGQRENTDPLTRHTSFTYYDNGLLHTSVLSPADSRYKTTTTNEYDAWGNTTKVSVTAATNADGSGLATRTKHYVYDARGRYLASERNALNEQISYTYNGMSPDLVTGPITESRATDPNGFWVDKFQDAWGRETGSASKDGLTANTSWTLCSATSDCGEFPSALLVETKTASAKPTEQVFYDRFGRALGSRHQGFADNSWVYKKTDYDAKGRAAKHYEPTYSGVSTINATTVVYDDFDRITQQTAPNGSVSNTYYYGHRTRVEDHYGNYTEYLNAATGEKFQVTDTYGSRLEYLYDGYGNLLKVWAQAAAGPEVVRTSTEHDLYGRKVATIDLDKGRWTYQYNAFGELLTQTNANGDQVSFAYDVLGRKISRLEPEGLSCWRYGNASTGDIGRLLSERTYSNLAAVCDDVNPTTEKAYAYDDDDLGLLTSTTYQYGGAVFQTEQSYDDFSRPDVITYPGSSVKVKHHYTSTGYLKARTHASTGALYQRIVSMDARGNPDEVVYGNGTTESRTYKQDTGWLESITLQKATLLHKLDYTFDKQGNLEHRTHELAVAKAQWSEDYLYDDLYRLTDRVISVAVDGLGAMPAAFKTDQNYQYDDWGNIRYKSGTGYYQYDESSNPYRLLNICADGACDAPSVTNATYTCPAGYTYNAAATRCDKAESKPADVDYDYYCPAGYTLNAATNDCRKTESTAASVSYTYSCAAGYSYNSSTQQCEKAESKAANATTTPTCNSGYSYNSSTGDCRKTETQNASVSYTYSCASGYSYNSTTSDCRKTETQSASVSYTYSCASGYSYNSSTGDCRKTEAQAATPSYSYSCPSGYSYNSSAGNCRKAESKTANVSYTYSCSSGWTLSGTSCSKTETKAATATQSLSCPSGYSYYGGGKCRKFAFVISPTPPFNAVSCSSGEPMGGGNKGWECTLEASQITKTTYSCDSGWTLSGSSCSRTLTASATQNTNYSCDSGWSLSGSTCSRTLTASATQNTSYSCSSGWSLSGSTCSRTLTASATQNTHYSCSSGWSLSGSSCSRTLTAAATQNTHYSCSSGWTLSGSSCSRVLTQTAGSQTNYSCDSGWSLSGTSCNRLLTATATQNTHYSCAAGWTLNGSNCDRTLIEPQIADPVEQCPAGYSYNAGAGNCQKVETQTASSSVSYSCPAGYTLSGQSCTKAESQSANQSTTLVCPSGYNWSVETGKCRNFEIIDAEFAPSGPEIEFCDGGDFLGNGLRRWECWVQKDPITKTTYSCDSGWNLSGQTCSRTLTQAATSNTVYSCSSGWTLNGSSCNRTLTATATIYQCDAGWTLNGSSCSRTLTAAASSACPAGTTQVGSECHRYQTPRYNFAYDNQGNVLSDGNRTFAYTSYDLVSRIDKGAEYSEFKYDAGRSRYSRTDSKLEDGYTAIYQTTYVAGLYEKVERTGGGKADLTEHKFYVGNAVITERSTGNNDIFYLHKDHQGSTTTVTDAQGTAVQQFVYDPWGKQTHAFVASKLNDVISPAFTRGYTGHEHLPHVDIIHMNGRIYDANIARFMQADPFIQSPSDFQNYNRYAYVNNNPMSYSDPSGFFFNKLVNFVKKYWRTIAAIAISIYLPGAGGLLASWGVNGAVLQGAITGFVSGAVSTGTLKGAFVGALAGAAFGALHSWKVDGFNLGKVAAHGAVGGVSSVLNGGKFGHGFLSAGFTQAAGQLGGDKLFVDGATEAGDRISNAMKAALIGGTASAISGGKFSNGAVTGAFSRLLNDDLRADYKSRKRTGAPFYTLEGDIEASLDQFPNKGSAGHEFHIYKGGKEIGVYANGQFIAKHGFDGSIPEDMTENALKRLNGLDVDMQRRQLRIPEKGKANIKQIFKSIGRISAVAGPAIAAHEIYQAPSQGHTILGEMLGITTMGDGTLYPQPDGAQF